jgi:hypothetical protein
LYKYDRIKYGRSNKIFDKERQRGDIYYFIIEKRYYFLKIIRIDTRIVEAELNKKETWYCYYVIVFEKSYSKLPENKDEINFTNIYQIKYKPKNTLLY